MVTADDVGARVFDRLQGYVARPHGVSERASWRDRLASTCDWIATRLRGEESPTRKGGKLLAMERVGSNLGYGVYRVYSRRGGFSVGKIDWSNQWHRARFKADFEAVFDQTCIAEIYAMMKELR